MAYQKEGLKEDLRGHGEIIFTTTTAIFVGGVA
jgi:hypothetical protein